MSDTTESKIDLLKTFEELLVGTLFTFFRMAKTSFIFVWRPSQLITYLNEGLNQPEGAYILPHHTHIVRPMTYATLCSISFFVISFLLVFRIQSGYMGIPSIELPDIQEITDLIKQLYTSPLSHIILLGLPYVIGIVTVGCLTRGLLVGSQENLRVLTSIYLSSYFFGVALLLVTLACLCFVLVAYAFSSSSSGLSAGIFIVAVYILPLLIAFVTLLTFIQLCRCLKQLSGLPWWRCLIAAVVSTAIFAVSLRIGVSLISL